MTTARLQRFHLDGIHDTGIEIGRGSYAVVNELDFRGLRCVGKEIHSLLYEEAAPEERDDMLQRFEEECELLGRLHHPNVVQFLGVHVGASSRLPTLVMEYLPVTLSSCVDRHGVLPAAEISLGILRGVALGLRYLHEHSPPIIHRDLSANNVLLTTSMSAKISDLGVAKILDMSPAQAAQMTQTQVPGTPTYMPPETMVAHPRYTSKVDVFSLGVMMVHVLSGEWPMPSEGYAEDPLDPNNLVVVAEFDRRRSSIEKIEDGHPLLGLIRQCLSNVPNRRPDAVEVVRQLRVVCTRVPPQPENRLELLQQVQSLRAALQQNSGEENEILRRENETLQADLSTKIQDNNYLRREVQTQQTERRQNRSQIEALQTELSTKTQEIDTLRRDSEALQIEARQKDSVISSLGDDIERMRSEVATGRSEVKSLQAEIASKAQEYERDRNSLCSKNSLLLQQVQSLRAELQSSREKKKTSLAEVRPEELAVTSLIDEMERMRIEMASVQNRSRAETESLRTEVQRLTLQQSASAGSPVYLLQQRAPTAGSPVLQQRASACSQPQKPIRLQWKLQWRSGRDALEEITGAQAVVMGENVYVDAGRKVHQYHWRTDTWNILPVCPVKLFGMAQFLGELVIVGGRGSILPSSTVYHYSEQSQKWMEFLPPMPTARYGLTVVTRASSSPALVACGGRSQAGDRWQKTVEVFSHASFEWYTAKSLPHPCFSMTSVTIDDNCFIIDKSSSNNCFSAHLDSLIDNATSCCNEPIWLVSKAPLEQSVAVNLRGHLMAIGGVYDKSSGTSTASATSSAIHVLTYDGSWSWWRWEESLPQPRWGSAAVCLPSGELLIIGGYNDKGYVTTVVIASITDQIPTV